MARHRCATTRSVLAHFGPRGDAIDHTEFKLGVTVWSLETEDEKPCDELIGVCRLIHADELTVSPAEMYSRAERITLRSRTDSETFVSIDLTKDPTDQMEVVCLSVRCEDALADAIHEILKSIRERSEVKTALLRGNLGLASP